MWMILSWQIERQFLLYFPLLFSLPYPLFLSLSLSNSSFSSRSNLEWSANRRSTNLFNHVTSNPMYFPLVHCHLFVSPRIFLHLHQKRRVTLILWSETGVVPTLLYNCIIFSSTHKEQIKRDQYYYTIPLPLVSGCASWESVIKIDRCTYCR